MYSKYNYSPMHSTKLAKSRSTQNYYRAATQRGNYYQSSLRNTNKECLACQHQSSKNEKSSSKLHQINYINQKPSNSTEQYYKLGGNDELTHLRKSKRFLQELIERNKSEFKTALQMNEIKTNELKQQIQRKKQIISQLQNNQNLQQLRQQYAVNTSLVDTYRLENDKLEREKPDSLLKVKQLMKKITFLEDELRFIKRQSVQDKKKIIQFNYKQQKLKDLEIISKEYDSMKILIAKMQAEKQQSIMKYNKRINQIQRKTKLDIMAYTEKLGELNLLIQQKNYQLGQKHKAIERTRVNEISTIQNKYEHFQELIEQKNQEIEKLQSKISCIQSQVNFIKNRFGYLLKMSTKNGNVNIQELGSNQQLQSEYCIERIGRYNISNAKQSLISMNLSPIKKR